MDFVLVGDNLRVKFRSGELIDAEIIGTNDKGYFFRYNNNIGFYAKGSVNDQLLAKYISQNTYNRGFALANTDSGLLFVKSTNAGNSFTIFKDGVITPIIFNSASNSITLSNGSVVDLSQNSDFLSNFVSYKENDLRQVTQLKDNIKATLRGLNFIADTELDSGLEEMFNSEEIVGWINELLEERKYLGKDVYKYRISEDGTQLIKEYDPTVLPGNVFMEAQKLQSSEITSLEIIGNSDLNQNLYRFKVSVTLDGDTAEYTNFYIEKTNNGWVLKETTSNPEVQDSRISELIEKIKPFVEFDDNIIQNFVDYFDAIKNGTDISDELNENIDLYRSTLPEELDDQIHELQMALKEECSL
jgi:hypothetical protein